MSVARTTIAAIAALSAGAPRLASAQFQATVDAGAASVRYADSVRLTATTLAPALRFDAGNFTARASGAMSLLGAGSWSSQGGVAIGALSPPLGMARLELTADAGGSMHQDRTRTGRYLGLARAHAGSAAAGLWLGGGAGRTWDGESWLSIAQGDAGAWARLERLALVAFVTPSAVGDSLRYTDVQSVARWEGRRADFTVSAGLRVGDALVRESANAWGSASATLWVSSRVGLVGDIGSYPVDFTQGFPGGRYLSIAIRMATQRRAFAPVRESALGDRTASPAAALVVHSRADGRRTVRVHAPHARRVEIMGDFTGWKPATLARSSHGAWELVMAITPGTYHVNIRLDGGPWGVPVGTLQMTDEFGSPVGLVVIR